MRLATILMSMLLVLGLAAMGCDYGSNDSGDDTTTGDGDATTPDDDAIVDPDPCDAICVDKCGVIDDCPCGDCEAGFECVANLCAEKECVPDCTGKQCGSDGCVGSCGDCTGDLTCNETTGMCENICVPDCAGKQCGPDTCGGSCGLCPCVGCDPSFITCDDASGQCVGQDELTCAEINDCMGACNPQDPSYETCIQNCKTEGSAEAQGQFNELYQCAINNGAQGCTNDQCVSDIIMEHCMAEYEACFPAGTLSCSEVFGCMDLCAQGDQTCYQACFSDGSAEAQAQYQAIAACVIEQCGEQPTEECFTAAQQGVCAAVFADCFPVGKPGFATGPNGGSSSDYVNMKMWLMGLDKDKLYNHH